MDVGFILHLLHIMQIKRELVNSLITNLAAVDKVSRKKNLTQEESSALSIHALRACRSILSTLRKLK